MLAIGLIGLFTHCKKEGTEAVMLANPVAPTISNVPALTFVRAHGTDSLQITGTAINAGFQASVSYYLEVDTAGNNFQNAIVLATQLNDKVFRYTVSDLNGLFIRRFPTDTVSSAELRIRAVLVSTGSGPFSYVSPTKSVSVTTYGLPRLDIIGSGINQKIESPLGDGNYSDFVKLTAGTFTLRDPDAGISYGDNSGALGVNGAVITIPKSGWYFVTADTKALTYKVSAYMIGIVGDFDGWSAPDPMMDYNSKTGQWYINYTFPDAQFKFRKNEGWDWNLGGTASDLEHNGANIPISAGTYTIYLTITNDATQTGSFSLVKH